MKIAFFVHKFPPEFFGGTEQVVLALAHAFKRFDDEVVVVTGSERHSDGGEVRKEEFDGIRVLRVLRDPTELYGLDNGYPITGTRISDLLADEQPSAVHVHHWWTLGWDILQRAAGLGIRGGATIHDLWLSCPRFFRRPPEGVRCPTLAERGPCLGCMRKDLPGAPDESIQRAIERRDRALRRELSVATFLAVPSESTKRLIARHVPWDRELLVLPHGLLSDSLQRSRPREHKGPLRVGSFGNLVPEKGLHLIVEALAGLGEATELRLSGHFPDGAYLERLKKRAKELEVTLVWTGSYTNADRHPAHDIDLAVFPSLCQESYGLVVDEALSRGVPVIVSNRGALPERARGGGIVLRSGGVMPLHVALARLLRSNRELEKLRDEIPLQFRTIETAARRYRELLLPAGVR
ncbi:MAG: glycosyltransferase [Planctomycetota bacterium]